MDPSKFYAAAFAVAFGIMWSAIGESYIAGKGIDAMGRNPSMGKELFPRMIVAMALAETPAIFAFVVSLIILFL